MDLAASLTVLNAKEQIEGKEWIEGKEQIEGKEWMDGKEWMEGKEWLPMEIPWPMRPVTERMLVTWKGQSGFMMYLYYTGL